MKIRLKIRLTSRPYKDNYPDPWRPYFPTDRTHFQTQLRYYWDKCSDKVYEDWTINVTSRVFELDQDNIGTNLLTEFHEYQTINVASRVLTWQNVDDGQLTTDKGCSQKLTMSTTSQEGHDGPIAHLRGETNVLSKFHENWTKSVTSTVFTCFHYIHIEKNAPPTGDHVFSPIPTIFKLVRDFNKTNPNRENCHYIHIEKNAPPTGGHVFSPISTIFELVRDIK
ncbi:hypothetical protein DPMN_107947 [Dreissena polymorpha]|uniref:Uncharacterized protein n=1 Tax=Dreissena polymorpha TaxID=45954 RepID=A0A9D4QKG1_DREPO|nr:hypothetical protein DPMN_107947 [Dreissena polymorpha]